MSEVILYPIKQTYPEGLETPLNMIHRYFMRLYEESLDEPEYMLLCLQDYLELLDEVSHLFWHSDGLLSADTVEKQGDCVLAAIRQDPWIRLANTATGKFALVSTLPDLPRCQEFSKAHLAFAHRRHATLPTLKSGEIIALCPSSAEKYLDRKYGRKPCE